ncbi:hypothetical protein N7520_003470 [Penicillium odoratum]|uniref:uncharacterized protein n=1 Tax=Penicillium odoratum TaxID=1167516 RepID=UPI002547072C|nr:uncharacterized protein N7520_003470 [Penicillium odoratum]KAJ5768911.1 hypothetical protein N7520_003470 [Penicillium odoratum]
MYFLATPHRGADSAQLAKLVRRFAGYGPKAYLDDLIPGHGTLDQINDEFRHVGGDIHLWSFTEGSPIRMGLTSSLVVEKESAVLGWSSGLPKEHVQYIDADYRQICKFDSPMNANYVILQRAFQTTIEEIGADVSFQGQHEYRSQMKKVGLLLRIGQRPDAILLSTNEKQHSGTCQWLTECQAFQEWVDDPMDYAEDINSFQVHAGDQAPRVLWLKGRPGTGKTVAAGHVIRYLQFCNLDCSFYFFQNGNKADATVAAFLRSVAYQMAESSFKVRRVIASMADEDIKLPMTTTTCFGEVFLSTESSRRGVPALISMLSSSDWKNPARILVTSLPGGQLERLFNLERIELSEIATGQEGSLNDIELLAKARCPRGGDVGPYQDLVSDVIAKSNGIFLWASLTVAKLEDVYSVEDKQDVLRQIPVEMDLFYTRIIASIADSPSFELAKCILKWTICSPKPLHIEELAEAVRLDIGHTITASARQLETLTGHLIFVDNNCRIHVTHQTASAFLTKERALFWIDRPMTHSQIAEICLTILSSVEFSPPRARRAGMKSGGTVLSPLSDYALHNFSYHLVHGSSAAINPLKLLHKFLRSNVLVWIEKIARTGNIWNLQLTAQRLKAYLSRRAKNEPPVSTEMQTIAAWATDLYYIAAAFHSNLLTSPSSIYFIIPYLCPPKSIIAQLFGRPSKLLRVTAQLEESWNDRLACYLFTEVATAVASSTRLMAADLANGDIRIYHITGSGTFDPAGNLAHGKRLRHLAFNQSSSLLASCSVRKLVLWDVEASHGPPISRLWSLDIDFTPSCMAFHPDGRSLVLANHDNSSIISFKLQDGQKIQSMLLHASSGSDSGDSDRQVSSWTPSEKIRFDPSHSLAALAYRNASIVVWDLNSVEKIGKFEKEGFEDLYSTPPALDMIFNPVAELELLAITYKNGDIVICNPWTLEQKNHHHLQVLIDAMAATTDGRVLAGAADNGEIYLFMFETLQPLYRIGKPDDQFIIHEISFSADNLRLLDIRGQCCNVWEPFVLVPKDGLDDSSSEPHSKAITVSEPDSPQMFAFDWGRTITAIESSTHAGLLFVGRQDGMMEICELSSGDLISKLQLHDTFAPIELIEWNDERSCMLSVDITGRCILTQFSSIGKGAKLVSRCLLDNQEQGSVRQALMNPKAKSILICKESVVKLIGPDGTTRAELKSLPGSWRTRHQSNNDHLIAIRDDRVHLMEWGSLKSLFQTNGVPLRNPDPKNSVKVLPWVGGAGSGYLVQADIRSQARAGQFSVIEASKITTETKEIVLHMHKYESLNVESLLGCLRSNLFFLDTGGWVCSIGLKNLDTAIHYTRHFFIPPTWRTGVDVIKIISKSTVAFGRGEWLIIFHGFLELEEMVLF